MKLTIATIAGLALAPAAAVDCNSFAGSMVDISGDDISELCCEASSHLLRFGMVGMGMGSSLTGRCPGGDHKCTPDGAPREAVMGYALGVMCCEEMVSTVTCGTAMLLAAGVGPGAMNSAIPAQMDEDLDGNMDQCSDAYFAANYGEMGINSTAAFCAGAYEPLKASPFLVDGTIAKCDDATFSSIMTSMPTETLDSPSALCEYINATKAAALEPCATDDLDTVGGPGQGPIIALNDFARMCMNGAGTECTDVNSMFNSFIDTMAPGASDSMAGGTGCAWLGTETGATMMGTLDAATIMQAKMMCAATLGCVTDGPTAAPTATATDKPTAAPTAAATDEPTAAPTAKVTEEATEFSGAEQATASIIAASVLSAAAVVLL